MAKAKSKKVKMDMQAMMKIYTKVGTPGAPHKRLASLAGNWVNRTTAWMDPDNPMESKGACKQKMILDGRYLQQEYSGKMDGATFQGINLIGFDNYTKKYQSIWIDSMSTGIYFFEGTASPNGKTITQKSRYDDPARGPLTWKSVTRIVNNDTMVYEMYITPRGGREKKEMEMTLTRKK
ncbi:MAG: DUF1579 domain-containing protein [Deltaproteobacteria bacterium]|nr:DUF1579 domain-containing protein [Deltaproteobacteria bacterium]